MWLLFWFNICVISSLCFLIELQFHNSFESWKYYSVSIINWLSFFLHFKLVYSCLIIYVAYPSYLLSTSSYTSLTLPSNTSNFFFISITLSIHFWLSLLKPYILLLMKFSLLLSVLSIFVNLFHRAASIEFTLMPPTPALILSWFIRLGLCVSLNLEYILCLMFWFFSYFFLCGQLA